jgi:putative addiction module component (TIGR02574 family)
MTNETKKILENVLGLPAKQRAVIADQILTSLDQPDANIDKQWRKEIESRIEAYESGNLKKVSLDEVLTKYQK